jgi:hypothetical protein
MAGSDRVIIGQGPNRLETSANKAKSLVDMPKSSSAKTVKAESGFTAGSTWKAVTVPAGAYVYQVGLYSVGPTNACVAMDLNVGDGVATARYLDGITAIPVGDIVMSGCYGSVAGDMVGGHYYAAEDTIDVLKVATGTTGTIKLLVWYTFLT